MNGITAGPDERAARKRQLEADLALVRTQKAEVLRSIQQIAKKQRLGGPPTHAQNMSHEAKVQNAKLEHARRNDAIFAQCTKIVQELLKNLNVKQIFAQPVPRHLYPHYYEIIKNPIDLSIVKQKLDSHQYNNVYEFRDDMRLLWQNCRTFNPPGEVVRKYGDNASDQFESKYVKYHLEPSWEAEQKRFALEMEKLEAEAKTLPDKLREVDAELQELTRKVAERENPPPPGPGREMSFEEKRKLSHALGTLPGERLTRVLEIIAEGPSAPQPDSEEEFELDIDALDTETQWKLHAYVEAVSNELAAKAPKPAAAAGEGGDGAAGAPKATATSNAGDESEEGVGSKGNDGSAMAGGAEVEEQPKREDVKNNTANNDMNVPTPEAPPAGTAKPPAKEVQPMADDDQQAAATENNTKEDDGDVDMTAADDDESKPPPPPANDDTKPVTDEKKDEAVPMVTENAAAPE